MIDISSQDATESKLRALINLGNAFSWDTPDPAIRRGPDRGNASLEIYCENNRTNRVCLVARLLLEFTRSVWGLSGERISQLSLRQNKKCNRQDWLSVISYGSAKSAQRNKKLKHEL